MGFIVLLAAFVWPLALGQPLEHGVVDAQSAFCGCEEAVELETLRERVMTTQDFLKANSKLYFGRAKAKNGLCAGPCLALSIMATHFTPAAGKGVDCDCYADLRPFHCEEEEGVALARVECISMPRSGSGLRGMKRPMLTMLNRRPIEAKSVVPTKAKRPAGKADLRPGKTTALVAVLLCSLASACIVLMACKTYCDNAKDSRKKQSKKVVKATDSTATLYRAGSSDNSLDKYSISSHL